MANNKMFVDVVFRAEKAINELKALLRKSKDTNYNIDVNVSSGAQNKVKKLTQSVGDLENQIAKAKIAGNNFGQFTDKLDAATGKTTRLAKSFGDVGKELGKVGRGFDDATSSATEFGRSVALAAKRFAAFTVAAGSMYAVVRAMKEGVSEAIEWDSQLNKIRQVSGDSASSIREIGNEVLKLSTNLGASSKQLIESAIVLKQAGLTADQVKQSLRTLAEVSLAPNFKDQTEATEGYIAAFQQFGKDIDKTRGIMGSMNAVAADFAVEAGDLVRAVQKAGGAFAQTGGSAEELIGIFTSVRSTTRESADSIATGLRTILTRFQRSETVEMLKTLGINLRYSADEAKALGDKGKGLEDQFVGTWEAVRRLSEGLKSLNETDPKYAAVLEQLGGYRQISRVIPLIQQNAEAIKAKNVAMLGEASLENSAKIRQDALANSLAKVGEEFGKLMKDFTQGDGFKTIVREAADLAKILLQIANVAKGALVPLVAIGGVLAAGQASKFISGLATPSLHGRDMQANSAFGNNGRMFGGVRRMATGGVVGGVGRGDKIPALLEPGEVVTKATSAKKVGYGVMGHINKTGELPRKYSDGGIVKPLSKDEQNKILQQILTDPSVLKSARFKVRPSGVHKQEDIEQLLMDVITGSPTKENGESYSNLTAKLAKGEIQDYSKAKQFIMGALPNAAKRIVTTGSIDNDPTFSASLSGDSQVKGLAATNPMIARMKAKQKNVATGTMPSTAKVDTSLKVAAMQAAASTTKSSVENDEKDDYVDTWKDGDYKKYLKSIGIKELSSEQREKLYGEPFNPEYGVTGHGALTVKGKGGASHTPEELMAMYQKMPGGLTGPAAMGDKDFQKAVGNTLGKMQQRFGEDDEDETQKLHKQIRDNVFHRVKEEAEITKTVERIRHEKEGLLKDEAALARLREKELKQEAHEYRMVEQRRQAQYQAESLMVGKRNNGVADAVTQIDSGTSLNQDQLMYSRILRRKGPEAARAFLQSRQKLDLSDGPVPSWLETGATSEVSQNKNIGLKNLPVWMLDKLDGRSGSEVANSMMAKSQGNQPSSISDGLMNFSMGLWGGAAAGNYGLNRSWHQGRDYHKMQAMTESGKLGRIHGSMSSEDRLRSGVWSAPKGNSGMDTSKLSYFPPQGPIYDDKSKYRMADARRQTWTDMMAGRGGGENLSNQTRGALKEESLRRVQKDLIGTTANSLVEKGFSRREANIKAQELVAKATVENVEIIKDENTGRHILKTVHDEAIKTGKLENVTRKSFIERLKDRMSGGGKGADDPLSQNERQNRNLKIGLIAGLVGGIAGDQLAPGQEAYRNAAEGTATSGLVTGQAGASRGLTMGSGVFGALAATGVGMPAALLGAGATALYGFVSGLKDAEREIRDIKIGKVSEKLADSLNDVLSSSNRGRAIGGAQAELNNLKALNSEKIADRAGGSMLWSLFNTTSTKDIAKIDKETTRETFIGNAGKFIGILNDSMDKFVKEGSGEITDTVDLFKKFNTGFNNEMISLLAKIRDIPIAQIEEDLKRDMKSMAETFASGRALSASRNAGEKNLYSISGISNAIGGAGFNAMRGFGELDYSGGFSGIPRIKDIVGGLSQMGAPGTSFAESLKAVTGSLGSRGKDLAETGKAADDISRVLPQIFESMVKSPDSFKGGVNTSIRKMILENLGVGNLEKDSALDRGLAILSGSLTKIEDREKNDGGLLSYLNKNPGKAAEEAIKDFVDSFREGAMKIAETFQKINEEYMSGLQKSIEKMVAIQGEQDKLSVMSLESSRARIETYGGVVPRNPVDMLSLAQLMQPFNSRQAGLGAAGKSPEELGALIQDLDKRIQGARDNFEDARGRNDGKAMLEAGGRLKDLTQTSINYQQALKNLIEPTQKLAAIQEKLSAANANRDARLGFTERWIRGGPEGRFNMMAGANDAKAIAGGRIGLGNLGDRRAARALDFMDAAGNAMGPDGRPWNQHKANALGGFAGALDGGQEAERKDLLNKQAQIFVEAERAQAEYLRLQKDGYGKFTKDLDEVLKKYLGDADKKMAEDERNKMVNSKVMLSGELAEKQRLIGVRDFLKNSYGVEGSDRINALAGQRDGIQAYVDAMAGSKKESKLHDERMALATNLKDNMPTSMRGTGMLEGRITFKDKWKEQVEKMLAGTNLEELTSNIITRLSMNGSSATKSEVEKQIKDIIRNDSQTKQAEFSKKERSAISKVTDKDAASKIQDLGIEKAQELANMLKNIPTDTKFGDLSKEVQILTDKLKAINDKLNGPEQIGIPREVEGGGFFNDLFAPEVPQIMPFKVNAAEMQAAGLGAAPEGAKAGPAGLFGTEWAKTANYGTEGWKTKRKPETPEQMWMRVNGQAMRGQQMLGRMGALPGEEGAINANMGAFAGRADWAQMQLKNIRGGLEGGGGLPAGIFGNQPANGGNRLGNIVAGGAGVAAALMPGEVGAGKGGVEAVKEFGGKFEESVNKLAGIIEKFPKEIVFKGEMNGVMVHQGLEIFKGWQEAFDAKIVEKATMIVNDQITKRVPGADMDK